MGTLRTIDSKESISVFEVTSLTTGGLTGNWLADDWTFGLNPVAAWDDADIHRLSPVLFNGKWIAAYDAKKSGAWKIGIASR